MTTPYPERAGPLMRLPAFPTGNHSYPGGWYFVSGCPRPSAFPLTDNADRRAERQRAAPAFYSPEQVEALARSLAAGTHRERSARAASAKETAARAGEDAQDGELVRFAAYAGLRRGELVALRWRAAFRHTARDTRGPLGRAK